MKNNRIILGAIISLVILFAVFITGNQVNNDLKIISKTQSDFGPVWIFEKQGTRCMSFLEPPFPVVQSCMFIKDPKIIVNNYVKLFTSTVFIVNNPKKILVIGLGGASVQKAFNTILPNTQIDTVEINSSLPELAKKYFNYKEDNLNKIFVEDGVVFAKNATSETYDIIFIDAFSVDYIPPQMLTDGFMMDIKRMLTQNGVVAINTFLDSEYSDLESSLFKRNFGNYYNLVAGSSRVMIAGRNPLPEQDQINAQANLWLYRFVDIGIDQRILLSLFNNPL